MTGIVRVIVENQSFPCSLLSLVTGTRGLILRLQLVQHRYTRGGSVIH